MTKYHQLERPPEISAATAAAVLEEAFGMRGGLQPLHADRDRNFGIVAESGDRYVLKFQNPADGEEVLDLQAQALAHIARVDPTLPIAGFVNTASGRPWHVCIDETGRRTFARLLVHLDGHHADVHELDHRALYDWGVTVARTGRALRGFFHVAAGYHTVWDLQNFPHLRRHLPSVPSPCQPLVVEVLERYDRNVAPILASLRAQLVHNDMGRHNVLVNGDGAITGILDFGDMTHTPLINDLAVAVADVVCGRHDAMAAAPALIAGYHSVTPLEPEEAQILADLVAARCATSILLTIAVGDAPPAPNPWALLTELQELGFDRVGEEFADAVNAPLRPHGRRESASSENLLAARRRTLGPLELSYSTPLPLVEGQGVHLIDAAGKRYLDAYNNVPVVGHSHPHVVRVVSEQLRRLNTNTRYLHSAAVELAERLLATAPDHFDRVLLVNSGSEANDLALRIVRWATGRTGPIATAHAYHGITAAIAAVSPESWPEGAVPEEWVQLVRAPGDTTTQSDVAASTVAEAAQRLSARGVGVAALCVDSAFTSDGISGPAPDWLGDAARVIHEHGGLFIADEVQAGYGRTGQSMWSVLAAGAVPDVITLGKPMGNGYPVAAVLTSSGIADDFIRATGYFSTFGGNTAACAAALAVLDTIEDEHLIANAADVGGYLLERLTELAGASARLGEVRGWGLLVGVDVIDPGTGAPDGDTASRIVNRMAELGVLIGTAGPNGNVLKIRPPLVVQRHHVDVLADRLAQTLEELGE